ncbi:hypothetical protein BH11PSE2_BH11PSE2_12700 [soil metagenome]
MSSTTMFEVSAVAEPLRVGGWTLDNRLNLLSRGDVSAAISPLAVRLLQRLAAEAGCVGRDVLIRDLWNGNFLVGEPALTRTVSELRKALGDSPREARIVQTVPRVGYRLVRTMDAPAQAPARWTASLAPRERSWLVIALSVVVIVVCANWLMDTAIGLIWTLRH